MRRLRLTGTDNGSPPGDSIPFPGPDLPRQRDDAGESEPEDPDSGPDVMAAFNEVSRRMIDLARALGCPGYFDDEDDDRPTAA